MNGGFFLGRGGMFDWNFRRGLETVEGEKRSINHTTLRNLFKWFE